MTWISVKDKLPEISMKRNLFINGKNEVIYGYVFDIDTENNVWIHDMDRETNEIALFWMPLPVAPKEVRMADHNG